jgi:small-conductance mechanosensitive channel
MMTTSLAQDAPEQFSGEWWRERLLDIPLQLAGLIVIAVIVRYLLRKLIDRLVASAEQTGQPSRVLGSRRAAQVVFGGTSVHSERRALRARTLGSLAKSVITAVISTLVVIMAMEILGYPIGPILASAGIVGVALGFGAQNLVKDFLAGVMMLLEDQYGVGDVIDMGEANGVVEAVGLRVTRLRGLDGTVWYVRNGEVVRIGNSSQDWARAVIDIGVGYSEDPARVQALLAEVAHDLIGESEWSEQILEEPEVWGVENLGHDAVTIRLVVKTKPLQQWAVARELRERIKVRFDTEGIEIPFPQRTLWIRDDRTEDADSPS